MKNFFRETLITLFMAVIIFVLIQLTMQSFIVVGLSMYPSYFDGERLLVNKATYYLGNPERGDVVVFQPVNAGDVDYIKRIIALPGDTVSVHNKVVYVNGEALEEPYIKNPPRYKMDETEIPTGSYFVLGDNRNSSNDSHNGWVVPRQNIVGKAWVSIWPPDHWGLAPNYPLQEQFANNSNSYLVEDLGNSE